MGIHLMALSAVQTPCDLFSICMCQSSGMIKKKNKKADMKAIFILICQVSSKCETLYRLVKSSNLT